MKLRKNHIIELFFTCNHNSSFIYQILYIDDKNRIYFKAYKKDTLSQIGQIQSYNFEIFKDEFDSGYLKFDDKSKILYNNRLRKIKIKRLNIL